MQVNRIRELPQNSKIVATHTDSPDVRTHFCFFFFKSQFEYARFLSLCLFFIWSLLKYWFQCCLLLLNRSSFGMLKLNLIVMLYWELQNLVQIWWVICFNYENINTGTVVVICISKYVMASVLVYIFTSHEFTWCMEPTQQIGRKI